MDQATKKAQQVMFWISSAPNVRLYQRYDPLFNAIIQTKISTFQHFNISNPSTVFHQIHPFLFHPGALCTSPIHMIQCIFMTMRRRRKEPVPRQHRLLAGCKSF
jgi:hypothetical protein